MAKEKFDGKEVIINSPSYAVFSQLSDLRNFAQQVPDRFKDSVVITEESVEASYNGMSMGLRITEKSPNSRIVLESEGNTPFKFDLILNLSSPTPSQTALRICLEGEMNFMVKAMIGKKLQTMIDDLSDRIAQANKGGDPV